jgi:hypothetical protein
MDSDRHFAFFVGYLGCCGDQLAELSQNERKGGARRNSLHGRCSHNLDGILDSNLGSRVVSRALNSRAKPQLSSGKNIATLLHLRLRSSESLRVMVCGNVG